MSIIVDSEDVRISADTQAICFGLNLNQQLQDLILEKGIHENTIDEISNLSKCVKNVFLSEPVVKESEKDFLNIFDVKSSFGKEIYLLKDMNTLEQDYQWMKERSKTSDSYVLDMDALSVLMKKISTAQRLNEILAKPAPVAKDDEYECKIYGL